MDASLITTDSLMDKVAPALAAASGKWTGCDWPTQFGPSRLDLRGVRSSQAILMATATAGSEASDWRNAVTWLKCVEQDARQAESEAQTAVHLARSGKLRDALQCADRACAIEAHYRTPHTWRPLRDAIEAALLKVDRNEPEGAPEIEEPHETHPVVVSQRDPPMPAMPTTHEAAGRNYPLC